MKSSQRTLLVWLFLVVGAALLLQNTSVRKPSKQIAFPEFIEHVKKEHVASVTFKNQGRIVGTFKKSVNGGKEFSTVGDTDSEYYVKLINDKGLVPNYDLEDSRSIWMQVLIGWVPMILILVLLFVFLRQIQASGGKAMSFGRSRARLLTEGHTKVTFKDVAGCDEAKEELKEVVDFLKSPRKFTKLGGKIPKGILLVGPPGTGKTLLAKAVAGEAVVPFFTISGSDFVEMFVGVGASRVRDLFEQGKKHAPCIIFIDEIDAVGRQRGAGLGGGHDEREQTLNQLLVEMDGFDSKEGVILVAATNRPDVLDPALLRPGRFDRNVIVSTPDVRGREGILKVHAKNKPLSDDVDLGIIAQGTPGFSGADLQNLLNEAALLAARGDKSIIEMHDIENAKDKVLMGPQRPSMVISLEEKKRVAYHEAGHTIVGASLPGLDPIHKVTIIPRGRALGLTQTLPNEDQLNLSRQRAEKMISFLMGGTLAEELIFGERTTGAGDDINKATDLAKRMVTEWGMSEVIGPIALSKKDQNVFLGREFNQHNTDMSQKTAELVDEEIRSIIGENYNRAREILKEKTDILEKMSEALLERETLNSTEIQLLMERKELPPMKTPTPTTSEPKTPVQDTSEPTPDPVPATGKPEVA